MLVEVFIYFTVFTVSFAIGAAFGVGLMACIRRSADYDLQMADMLDDAGLGMAERPREPNMVSYDFTR